MIYAQFALLDLGVFILAFEDNVFSKVRKSVEELRVVCSFGYVRKRLVMIENALSCL